MPTLVALIFGFLAFRSRIKGVYFAIITQALALVAWLVFNRNETNLGGTNGLTDFKQLLGFRLSDSTHMMEFLRCSADHHSIAIFRNNGPSLNHVAYELPNIDGLMRGAGRLKRSGFDVEWGVGRHGPGSNVFSYFIEPNGFVAEYTTELDQLDDATHVPQDASYWQKMMPNPDRWGLAGPPSNRMRAAMSGALYLGERELSNALAGNARCEDIIGRKLG